MIYYVYVHDCPESRHDVTLMNYIYIYVNGFFFQKEYNIVSIINTHPKWKLYTFIMGFTMHEKKTPVPSNVGIGIQSLLGMLNFISWGIGL